MLPAAAAVAAYLLPQAIPHPAIGITSNIATYLLRLTAVGGIVTHLVSTTTPTEFTAALRAARISRAITGSGAVMLRFLPTITAEARAIRDAIRLRGIGRTSVMLRHAIRSIEYFTAADRIEPACRRRPFGHRTTAWTGLHGSPALTPKLPLTNVTIWC
ncbi:energy-coupling factor transporter transmembrane component T [Mycolicibacterium vulneris]|jgi:energy-coupling factor transport system permease protein|uniref:energy-coupling factor transporter transmembrane component T n=1 Tax=Mycolicibacterium vulneris TaxID=547163 RepID=UPI001FE4C77B|nr:energy-coupling factor transporter transmembrane component T [Mycolicibacterium vulneris]